MLCNNEDDQANARLIVLAGPPCSGKSTLGQALSKELNMQWLDLDQVRARVLPDSAQSLKDRDVAYRAMHLAAELLLRAGRNVILAATYSRRSPRLQVEELCRITQAFLFIVQCFVPVGLAVERYRAGRAQHPASDLTVERVRTLAETYPYCDLGLTIDTSSRQEDCLRQICHYLGASPVQSGWALMLQDQASE